MSKAERYIELVSDENGYLCDQHALKAVEIARKEIISEVCEWIDVNYAHYLDISAKGTLTANIRQLIEDLKQAMKDE